MTGYSPGALAQQLSIDGDVDMLHKPLTEAALEQRVRAALNQVA
jgi:FixJ family two-component response regulator